MTVGADWKPAQLLAEECDVAPSLAGLVDLVEDKMDLSAQLTQNRAIAFRGFHVTRETFGEVIDRLLPNRLSYTHGNTPRTNLGENIYTSTEYPADQPISMHNELSYAHRWPSRLLFFCALPAETGGATSVCDSGRWLRSLDPEVRDAFAGGLTYSQNLHGGRGLGKSWQQTFETDDKAVVERFLDEGKSQWTWTDSGLRITQTRPATTFHPVTGEEVWFNQVDQCHPAGLPDDIRSFMLDMMTPDELPQNATFADGSPIPDEYVLHIRDVGWKLAYDMDWRTGDVLLVENVLTSHARRPYSGKRQILVAMSS